VVRRLNARGVLVTVGLLLLCYTPLLLRGSAYDNGDLGNCTMPLLRYFAEAGDGWNPYLLAGRPGVIDGTLYCRWYPPTLLYLLLPADNYFGLSMVAHVILAALGMVCLVRSLGRSAAAAAAAAVVFAGSGFFTARIFLGQYPHVMSMAWAPWLFAAAVQVRRRGGPLAALALGAVAGVQLLAGFPQFVVITLLGIAVWWLASWRRRQWDRVRNIRTVLLLLISTGVFVAMTAHEIMPLATMLAHSQRAGGLADSESRRERVKMPGFLTQSLLTPATVQAMTSTGNYWEVAAYAGWAAPAMVLLALLRRRLWRRATVAWWAVGATALILACGVPLPGTEFLRSPGRFLLSGMLAAAVLTAYAADGLLRRARWRWLSVAVIMLELLPGSCLLTGLSPAQRPGLPAWSQSDRLIAFLRATPRSERMVALADAMMLNEAAVLRVETLNGYQGVVSGKLLRLGRAFDPAISGASPMKYPSYAPRLFALLGVRYVVTCQPLPGRHPVLEDHGVLVYENEYPARRAWLAERYIRCLSPAAALAHLGTAGFAPQREATGTAKLGVTPDTGPALVTLTAYQPGRLQVRTSARAARLLVISELSYPGWRATLDGTPVALQLVDGALLGLVVPAGAHAVTVWWEDPTVCAQWWLAVVGVLTALGSWLTWRRVRSPVCGGR